MRKAIRDHLGDFIAIILLVAVGLGTTGYILSNERLRFPYLEEQPFRVKVELENAQAVTAGQGQTVRVAGVRVGDIGDVDLEDGVAVVEHELDPQNDHLIREDATAQTQKCAPDVRFLVVLVSFPKRSPDEEAG